MAETAKTSAQNPIAQEVQRRASLARGEKRLHEDVFREAFKFCMPRRVPPGTSSRTPPKDADDNFTSLGPMMTADFASDIADTFWPEHSQWAESEASSLIPDELKPDWKEFLQKDNQAVFDAIAASNFYEESKRAAKDLSISAAGVCIQDDDQTRPIHCQMIPLNELLILRDARGGIGTRIWEQPNLTYDDVEALFGETALPKSIKAKKGKKGSSASICKLQGCYRDYSVKAETAWITFTMLDSELIESPRVVGEGSANIIVMRWDPDPCFAWGIGPAINALPDYRELDETRYLMLKGLARQVDPSIRYDDDSVMNFDGGLPHGVAIPSMKGSTIDVIESKNRIDTGYFAQSDIEHTIRRHYFLDEPEQLGKTPPTLGQWADQAMRRQRRLGTPAAPLWPEFLSEAYQRFRFLLRLRGLVQDFKVGDNVVQLRPINPLKRAANQDKAVASERFFAAVNNTFGPKAATNACNIGETIHEMAQMADAGAAKLKPAKEIDAAFAQDAQQQALAAMAEAAGKSGVGPMLAQGGAQGA